jgi:hypothetical protein
MTPSVVHHERRGSPVVALEINDDIDPYTQTHTHTHAANSTTTLRKRRGARNNGGGGNGGSSSNNGGGNRGINEAMRDYFLDFLPPHVRRKGVQLPPLGVSACVRERVYVCVFCLRREVEGAGLLMQT